MRLALETLILFAEANLTGLFFIDVFIFSGHRPVTDKFPNTEQE
jgi:hypothetical protein